jgi:hypothetical protein
MLGLLQLREDLQYRRIPPHQRVTLVDAALEDGYALAESTRAQWRRDPVEIAARCAVPVIRSEGEAGFGSVIVYADYVARPSLITLYLPAIRRLDGLIAQGGAQIRLGIDTALPIFLAHELYHHFDCLRGADRLGRRHRVRIFGTGRWQWTSGLTSLCEIAAGAFAQRLLGLSFHPKLLDLLLPEETKS